MCDLRNHIGTGAQQVDTWGFQSINRGYNSVFRPNRLSLGLVAPLEAYPHGPVPSMTRHIERVRLAEKLGFFAIWLRDVSFNVPSFGDAGQVYDPFVYLGLLAGQTERIALGVRVSPLLAATRNLRCSRFTSIWWKTLKHCRNRSIWGSGWE